MAMRMVFIVFDCRRFDARGRCDNAPSVLRRLCMAAALSACAAAAHEFSITSAVLVFSGDGGFRLDIGLDADALALGLPLESDSETVAAAMAALAPDAVEDALAGAESAVRSDIRLAFDGAPAHFRVEFPYYGTPAAAAADPPTVLGALARLSGRTPAGAREMTFAAAARYKTVDLQIFDAASAEPLRIMLRAGETSPPYPLGGKGRARFAEGVFGRYLVLGYTHILPKGLDHILFVLGLFLLSTRLAPLFWQITAFTLAHSAALALAALGIAALPASVVEPLIAASIVYVAVENVAAADFGSRRLLTVFAFGLLHGLGFAGVLRGVGLPEGRIAAALAAFNIGVEIGQISVVALAFLAVGRFRGLAAYRKLVVVPCSLAIAAVGLWWVVERSLGL